MEHFDLFIIGGGAAGIAAVKAAVRENPSGAYRIGLADRGSVPGGILRQCHHRGFGHELTGVEYANRLCQNLPEEVSLFSNTTVLSVSREKKLLLSSKESGIREISFDRLILATGCMEIPAGALLIAGTRPEGIYTAGEMQAMMNLEGFHPEGPVVILGSGDLGLIMADAISELEIPVILIEKKDSCGGLLRNRKCLNKKEVTLITGTTIREICGERKLESVILKGAEEMSSGEEVSSIPCRTLLIAVGLKPDQELVRGLESEDWLYLCGNCRQVHPMVEGVVAEGEAAGRDAIRSILAGRQKTIDV